MAFKFDIVVEKIIGSSVECSFVFCGETLSCVCVDVSYSDHNKAGSNRLLLAHRTSRRKSLHTKVDILMRLDLLIVASAITQYSPRSPIASPD